eukprot:1234548-Pleurochrysis_carterae.AAC.3
MRQIERCTLIIARSSNGVATFRRRCAAAGGCRHMYGGGGRLDVVGLVVASRPCRLFDLVIVGVGGLQPVARSRSSRGRCLLRGAHRRRQAASLVADKGVGDRAIVEAHLFHRLQLLLCLKIAQAATEKGLSF